MCEYCECQSVDAIAALTREHDAIRSAAHGAVAAADRGARDAAATACAGLLALLRPHVEIEELGLFPPMAGEFADHVAALEADHRQLEELLGRIADPAEMVMGWEQLLVGAVDDLVEHILREQDGLFPASLAVLGPEDWDKLDDVRIAVVAEDGRLAGPRV